MGWLENKVEQLTETVTLEAQSTRAELAWAFAQTQRGLRIDGALPRPVVPSAVNYNSGCRLTGWSVKATGGPVTHLLRNGNASGDIAAVIDLVDGESDTQSFGDGISLPEGLYVDTTGTGATIGSFLIAVVDG